MHSTKLDSICRRLMSHPLCTYVLSRSDKNIAENRARLLSERQDRLRAQWQHVEQVMQEVKVRNASGMCCVEGRG